MYFDSLRFRSPPDGCVTPEPDRRQFVVALLACVAAAAAQEEFVSSEPVYSQDDSQAQIIESDFVRDEQGGYSSRFDTSNDIVQTSSGKSEPGPEPETGAYRMEGEYAYTAPNGERIQVRWYADETGYHVDSASIPVAPAGLF